MNENLLGMAPPNHQRIWEVFEDALEQPEDRRASWLDQACGADNDLREQVDRLLAAHKKTKGILDETVFAPTLGMLPEIEPGRQIGPYCVENVLGEGGMGTVYRAHQSHPIKRQVALKIIKLGMNSRQIIRRFEAERQALAVMDHPNIARVFDAGTTNDGRPFFVMELVSGEPLLTYCDRRNLTTAQRLAIFVPICRAVQHAHQKGVIHRDLTPSNVLVAEEDGKPMAKVIDFGIAKAIGASLTEETLVTHAGQPIGTPAFMSPEQAAGGEVDIDTRTDVYSLGVVLYKLLVGELPLDPTEEGIHVFLARLAQQGTDAVTPSSKLTSLGDRQTNIARQRGTDPNSLGKELSGDLDWIVMKAMEKDRVRRYSTVDALANDLERYLADEPVSARPPSALYRFHKFLRRNRVPAVAAAAVMFALLAGAIAATLGFARATRAEEQARQEAATAQQVTDFLVDLFEVSDPSEAKGNSIPAREILDQGTEKLRTDLDSHPVVKARLLDTTGRVYQNLGIYSQAEPLLREALDLREAELGGEHPDVADSLSSLGWILERRGKFSEAEPLYRRALKIRQTHHGREHESVAGALNNLGLLLYRLGKYEEAEPLFRESLDVSETLSDEPSVHLSHTLNNLGLLLHQKGHLDSAEALFHRAIAVRKQVEGEDHPDVAESLNNLAILQQDRGEFEEAQKLFAQSLAMRRKFFGDEHPTISECLNNLAALTFRQGDIKGAEDLFGQALEIDRKLLGDKHYDVGISVNNLAVLNLKRADYRSAEAHAKEAVSILSAAVGDGHWAYWLAVGNHGASLAGLGQNKDAEREMRAAYDGIVRLLGEDHDRSKRAADRLVEFYEKHGHKDMARIYRQKSQTEP